MHHERKRRHRENGNGGEVADGVIRDLAVHRPHHHRAADTHQQRVSVRRRFGHEVRADRGRGAGTIFHDHRFAKSVRQFLRYRACDQVGRAPGGKRDHQFDRAVGVALRAGAERDEGQGRNEKVGAERKAGSNDQFAVSIISGDRVDSECGASVTCREQAGCAAARGGRSGMRTCGKSGLNPGFELRLDQGSGKKWWSGRGSNPRPSHCERDALPAELPPHAKLAIISKSEPSSRVIRSPCPTKDPVRS
jgi:hypothetical protein